MFVWCEVPNIFWESKFGQKTFELEDSRTRVQPIESESGGESTKPTLASDDQNCYSGILFVDILFSRIFGKLSETKYYLTKVKIFF